MFRSSLLPLLLFPLTVSAEDLRFEPYYPLKIGNRWTYQHNGQNIVMEVVKIEKVDGIPCAKVEARLKDKVEAWEYIAVRSDGVYRRQFNEVVGRAAQQFPRIPEKPLCLLKTPVRDTTWPVEIKVGKESLKGQMQLRMVKEYVAGGTRYEQVAHVTGRMTGNGQNVTFEWWYAPRVGMIRQVIKGGGFDLTLELKSFEPGK